MKCAVANCDSENYRQACDISFFSFPTDEALARKWMQFCRRGSALLNPKSSYVCMKHFSSEDIENNRQFEMGFAKKRLLKRGAVPSIYPEDGETSQRAESVQREEYKQIVSELLQQSEPVAVNEAEANNSANVVPIDENVENKENSLVDANLSEIPATSTPRKVFYYDSSLEEVEELEAQLKRLKRENKTLLMNNKKKDMELAALQQKYGNEKKKHDYEVEQLKKRLDEYEDMCKNMESKLYNIAKCLVINCIG
ncbi:PREDICTED: 52 kDa repressor of the inhibitor of the protein kinase-like isoform X2 [Rhagoletis zephyria]|uniref:52 kDa repressor of the inhibitor of the protein kinase-like isoform X2 n=2 Tax=Rhagoletis zephyria TaxID=28612 RepID=UPI0008112F75|nr:PREDICTED: 52 kDa repressor of the inhibitor of the protein kinase-like isoform X2 [Rhagoletis zephyria]